MKRGAKATQPTAELGVKLGGAALVAAEAVPAQRMARAPISFVMKYARAAEGTRNTHTQSCCRLVTRGTFPA
jgi:hypothetical protein